MSSAAVSWEDHVLFDDFLTASLIDNLYYWSKSRKFKHDFEGVATTKSIELITCYLIDLLRPDVSQCVTEFLSLPESQAFVDAYVKDSLPKLYEFKRHLRRYLQIYLPDCAFEVDTTDRYSEITGRLEGAVVARKDILPDDVPIKYLSGCLCQVPSKDTDKVSNLSVIDTSRNSATSLMLGPLRFVNHDCDPNCRFVPSAARVLNIVPVRKILLGEEITVYYSDNYFGKGNRDCQCATCERESKGYWKIPEVKQVNASEVLDLERLSESERSYYSNKTIDIIDIEDSSDEDDVEIGKKPKSKTLSPTRNSDSPIPQSTGKVDNENTKNAITQRASGSVSARFVTSAVNGIRNAIAHPKKLESSTFILSTSSTDDSFQESATQPAPLLNPFTVPDNVKDDENATRSHRKSRYNVEHELKSLGIVPDGTQDDKPRVLRGSKPDYSTVVRRRATAERTKKLSKTNGVLTLLDLYGFEEKIDKSATLNFLSSMYNKFLTSRKRCANCMVRSRTVPLCLRCKRHMMIYDISWPVIPVTSLQLTNKGNYISHVEEKSPDAVTGIMMDDDAIKSGILIESRNSLDKVKNGNASTDTTESGDSLIVGSQKVTIEVVVPPVTEFLVISSDEDVDNSESAIKTPKTRRSDRRRKQVNKDMPPISPKRSRNTSKRKRRKSTITNNDEKELLSDSSIGEYLASWLQAAEDSDDSAYVPSDTGVKVFVSQADSRRLSRSPVKRAHRVLNADLTDQSSDDESESDEDHELMLFVDSNSSTPRAQKRFLEDEEPWTSNKRESLNAVAPAVEESDIEIIDLSDLSSDDDDDDDDEAEES